MKLKVIRTLTSLDFGGVEKHMEIIANHDIAKSNIFISISSGGHIERSIAASGSEVFCLKKNPKIPNLMAIWSLFKFYKEHKPHVVHTSGAEANFHGLIAAWIAGVPVRVAEEIGIPSHGTLAKIIFRMAYLFSNKIIGISNSVSSWIISNNEAPAHKVVTVYNPTLLNAPRSANDIPADIFRIGFVGRLEPVKNPIGLLEAFCELSKIYSDCELWIIGDGSQKAELQSNITKHNLQSRVKMHGFQQSPEELIRQCSVYIQPSISEGFGIAIVEAMGCEIPVIATAVGGAPEIIVDGLTGWLIEDHKSNNILNALITAHNTPSDQMITIGKRARASIENRFDPKNYLEKIEAIYRKELSKNQGNKR